MGRGLLAEFTLFCFLFSVRFGVSWEGLVAVIAMLKGIKSGGFLVISF